MDRKEFLSKLGIGAAFALTASCLGGCTRDVVELSNVSLELDLQAPENAELLNFGGFLVIEGIVVARTIDGTYVAATNTCSHEQLTEITYDKNANEWLCTAHAARFQLDGTGLNANASKDLQVFGTSLTDKKLSVFSI
jgi:cytochrome b6-f complex iron-sulfur subunit